MAVELSVGTTKILRLTAQDDDIAGRTPIV
jgi:hypothetical protein